MAIYNPGANGHTTAVEMLHLLEAETKALRNRSDQSIQGRFNPLSNADMFGFGGMGNLLDVLWPAMVKVGGDMPAWSFFPMYRDARMRQYWKTEPIVGGAIYTVASKIGTLGYHLEGRAPRRKKFYADMFGECDGGAGLPALSERLAQCLLTQDNGVFLEKVGAGRVDKELKGPVKTINFIDPAQCWRTLDPEYPVIYVNPIAGTFHKLHHTRVVKISSMPQPDELGRGVGFSALSRALSISQIMKAINTYKQEKVSGKFERALLLLQGLNTKQVRQAMDAAEDDAESAQLTKVFGVPTIAQKAVDLTGQLIDFASLPDHFDYEKDVTIYVYILALCFGVDVREFWPATASGATKADATIQHLKARGKGIGELIAIIQRMINWQVIGRNAGVELEYDYVDEEEEKVKAEIAKMWVNDVWRPLQDGGGITSEQLTALAINKEFIDPDVLASAVIPETYDDVSPVTDETSPALANGLDVITNLIDPNDDQAAQTGAIIRANRIQNEADERARMERVSEFTANDDENDDEDDKPRKRKEAAKNAPLTPLTADQIAELVAADIDSASAEIDRIVK